jgi:hemolysin III
MLHPERVNQWTHFAGFVLSVIGAAVILTTVWSSGDTRRIVGCIIFAIAMVALYAASTLSHSFPLGKRRDFYRMLDQVCIFLMVVGSYTPFSLVYLRDDPWGALLPVMWLIAAVGIWNRIRGGNRTTSTISYILLAWLPVVAILKTYPAIQSTGFGLIIAGGLVYMVGTWFLANDIRRPYFHGVWHLSTIAGSAIHYMFLLEYVARMPAA